jgi:hypothetical protein
MKKTRKLLLTCLVILGVIAPNIGLNDEYASGTQDITINLSEDDMGPRH